jgi:hypothetical protein
VEFLGNMTSVQRDALLDAVSSEADKKAVEEMYDIAQKHPVPGWVPSALQGRAERWVQLKWPAAEWEVVKDHQYPLVGRGVCAAIVLLCLLSPRWWPQPAAPEPPPSEAPPANPEALPKS